MFTGMYHVFFVSKQISVKGLSAEENVAHIGTRHVPEHVNDFPLGSLKPIKSHG